MIISLLDLLNFPSKFSQKEVKDLKHKNSHNLKQISLTNSARTSVEVAGFICSCKVQYSKVQEAKQKEFTLFVFSFLFFYGFCVVFVCDFFSFFLCALQL